MPREISAPEWGSPEAAAVRIDGLTAGPSGKDWRPWVRSGHLGHDLQEVRYPIGSQLARPDRHPLEERDRHLAPETMSFPSYRAPCSCMPAPSWDLLIRGSSRSSVGSFQLSDPPIGIHR
jgi:hypothetical protein